MQRSKFWINHFQTRFFWRMVIVSLMFQATLFGLFTMERWFSMTLKEMFDVEATGLNYLPVAGVMATLTLLYTLDMVRFSHRIAGPVVRIRHAMRAIIDGAEMDLVVLRKNDFLQELKDEFNEMLLALEQRGAVTLKNRKTLPANNAERIAV